ncbi:MAG: IS110 family transposase [Woeseia sp.]
MATQTQAVFIGIDVSKAELAISGCSDGRIEAVANTKTAVRRWLRSLPPGAAIAVEATGIYHRLVVDEAHGLGHRVYLLDGYKLNRYRDAVGQRAKTDPTDARLIRRYLINEHSNLVPWTPPPAAYTRLYQLLSRRAVLVQARDAVRQSCEDLPVLKASAGAMLRSQARFIALIDKQIVVEINKAGWSADYRRLQAIEGIGPMIAAALVTAFHRGAFKSPDALVAFLGLDVRVRDSGKHSGKRKLTKKGPAEYRRLLYMAAMTASRSASWKPYYQHQLARGKTPTEAFVILARKLTRVAYALMAKQTEYRPAANRQAA